MGTLVVVGAAEAGSHASTLAFEDFNMVQTTARWGHDDTM